MLLSHSFLICLGWSSCGRSGKHTYCAATSKLSILVPLFKLKMLYLCRWTLQQLMSPLQLLLLLEMRQMRRQRWADNFTPNRDKNKQIDFSLWIYFSLYGAISFSKMQSSVVYVLMYCYARSYSCWRWHNTIWFVLHEQQKCHWSWVEKKGVKTSYRQQSSTHIFIKGNTSSALSFCSGLCFKNSCSDFVAAQKNLKILNPTVKKTKNHLLCWSFPSKQ